MDATAPPERRPLALRDCLVIVAAAALASWLLREARAASDVLWSGVSAWDIRLIQSFFLLFAATNAVFLLAILPPRPRLRLLARRPGFTASLTVAVYGLIAAGQQAALLVHWPASQANSHLIWVNNTLFYISHPRWVGPYVVLTWVVVGSGGFRTRGADWVEIAGRLLGVSWVVLWLGLIVLRDLLGIRW